MKGGMHAFKGAANSRQAWTPKFLVTVGAAAAVAAPWGQHWQVAGVASAAVCVHDSANPINRRAARARGAPTQRVGERLCNQHCPRERGGACQCRGEGGRAIRGREGNTAAKWEASCETSRYEAVHVLLGALACGGWSFVAVFLGAWKHQQGLEISLVALLGLAEPVKHLPHGGHCGGKQRPP